jgi:hypothetical protein
MVTLFMMHNSMVCTCNYFLFLKQKVASSSAFFLSNATGTGNFFFNQIFVAAIMAAESGGRRRLATSQAGQTYSPRLRNTGIPVQYIIKITKIHQSINQSGVASCYSYGITKKVYGDGSDSGFDHRHLTI